jgi:hypothetical protein
MSFAPHYITPNGQQRPPIVAQAAFLSSSLSLFFSFFSLLFPMSTMA